MPCKEGDKNADSVEQSQRHHEENLGDEVRRGQNRRKDRDADDRVADMADKEAVIDQTDARKEIGDYRKLEHHAKRQDQPRYQRKIFSHLDQRLNLNRFIPAQQKLESELQENFITENRSRKKKKRSKKHEGARE